jgi:hypothetical protein
MWGDRKRRRGVQPRRLLWLPLLLGGCVATKPVQQQAAEPAARQPAQASPAPAAGGAPADNPQRRETRIGGLTITSTAPTAVQRPLMPLSRPNVQPMMTRPSPQLQLLLAKGRVNGAELMTEVIAMRNLMRQQRSATAVNAFLGTLAQSATDRGKGNTVDLKQVLLTQTLRVAENAVKEYATSIGLAALDGHMQTLIDDPQGLANEHIQLPRLKTYNQVQAQRAVTMAAIVVATRVTGRMLKKAQQDFAGAEAEFTKLIARREKAATVLYDSLLKAGDGADPALTGLYDPQDLKYLRGTVASMSLRDFSNDLQAQNLALRYLARSDPQAYADYTAQADGLMSRTRGYVRIATGVAAFGGLLATFAIETVNALRDKQGEEVATLVPFVAEFVQEVPPLLKVVWDATSTGVVHAVSTTKRFRVVEGEKAEDLPRAREVFAALQKRESDRLLAEAIFREGSAGLLYKLYMCDRAEAGRLLDAAMPLAEREAFGAKYLGPDAAPRFSFVNAFQSTTGSMRERELGDELLRTDHRQRTADSTRALSEAQQSVTRNFARWNDEQLMRLIFANREGSAANATLQLGDTVVRPVPSMESVYAYESLVDGCRKSMAAPPPPPAPPPPNPPTGRKPLPAKPSLPTVPNPARKT